MMKWRFFTLAGAIGLGALFLSTDTDRYLEISKQMELFADVYRAVNDEYADVTDANKLMRTALDTMLDDLDPYTNFFSEAEMERLRIDVVGGWDGVGIETMSLNGKIVVRDVIDGSPAMKDGLRVGDVLLEIDGTATEGKKSEDVDKILNGKAGTRVRIKSLRPTTQKEQDLLLTREHVTRKNVPYYGMVDAETGYIVLTTFTERAGQNVADALRSLQEDHKPKYVILDLRENGGGLLVEAVNICNIFVPKNKDIVSTRNKVVDWDKTFKTLNNPIDLQIPLIVLINERSASASEIVAGAVQDLDRGLLVGRKSFGKGLVQNTKDVGYNSKVKLTTAKYYIPSGRCIQALEYKDGTPIEIPDSLKNAFKTASGRTVYDGGGLMPDYKLEANPESAIAKALKAKQVLFKFATDYRNRYDSIPAAKQFQLAEAEFDRFVRFVEEKRIPYQLETEQQLDKLVAQLQQEGFEPQVQPQVTALRNTLQTIKKRDLLARKTELLRLLEEEIVERYHYEKGRVEMRLRHDTDVQQAIGLFKNTAKFNELLSPNR